MSERFEEEPKMRLNMPSGEFDATPENTSLFTFLGRIACYSHVFMQTGNEDENTVIGTYVFAAHPLYEDMVEFMVENAYPMHVNLRDVAQCDLNAYDNFIKQQLDDIENIPEGWE